MRARLALAAAVAALAAAPFGAQASVNCHHSPWLCELITTTCRVSEPTYRLCSVTA